MPMYCKITTEIHTSYLYVEDITIIWQNLIVDDECIQRSLIGWYCGEPNEADTAEYARMPLTVQYTDDE